MLPSRKQFDQNIPYDLYLPLLFQPGTQEFLSIPFLLHKIKQFALIYQGLQNLSLASRKIK